MKYTLEVSKRDLDLLLRGVRGLLCEENDRSRRGGGRGWVPTKNYLAAEDLENRLIKLFVAKEPEEVNTQ